MTDYLSNTPLNVTGKNFQDCVQKINLKHPDMNFSIIEKGQKLESKLLGLRRKEYYEVTYLLKPRVVDTPAPKKNDEDFEKKRDKFLKTVLETTSNSMQTTSINSKLEDITKQLQSISTSQNNKHPTIQKIEQILSDNEFTFSYINRITERIKNEFSLAQLDDYNNVQRKVVDWIGESIKIEQHKTFRLPHVIVLVGPTGVGKTTTIAKFAAKQILDAKKDSAALPKLCIMTIDTMRVGAMEQLSHFGAILNTEVQKAETAKDVEKIYESNKDIVDTIYIDTAGYSPNDSSNIGKMKEILHIKGLNPDVYLVVSASTKASDLDNIMLNYAPFDFRSVIVTKCDETEKFGNVISALESKQMSVSYICDGQYAARNIEDASVINFLIRLQGFDVDRIHIEELFGEK